jgi:hypothetical protein
VVADVGEPDQALLVDVEVVGSLHEGVEAARGRRLAGPRRFSAAVWHLIHCITLL